MFVVTVSYVVSQGVEVENSHVPLRTPQSLNSAVYFYRNWTKVEQSCRNIEFHSHLYDNGGQYIISNVLLDAFGQPHG